MDNSILPTKFVERCMVVGSVSTNVANARSLIKKRTATSSIRASGRRRRKPFQRKKKEGEEEKDHELTETEVKLEVETEEERNLKTPPPPPGDNRHHISPETDVRGLIE